MSLNVADHCREQDILFDQFVERTGLDENRVMAILLGRWTPSPSEREKVATALDVSKDDISWGHKTPIQHIYGLGPG